MGIAYQPRVPTLGTHPAKQLRVLKERRIASVSRTSTPAFPMRCSFRTHLFSGMWFPGRMPWAGMRCPVGAKGTMAFPIPHLIGVAWGPSVETGADVPGYSGGLAAWMVVSDSDFL